MPVKDFLLVVKKNCRLRRLLASHHQVLLRGSSGRCSRLTLLGIITAPLLKMERQAVAVFRAVTSYPCRVYDLATIDYQGQLLTLSTINRFTARD